MSQNSGDLRVRRTNKLLQEALLALIEERGFKAITVREIAGRAMVSRAAFYRHYQDKYDLVEQVFKETARALANTFDPLRREVLRSVGQESALNPWAWLFQHVQTSAPTPEPWVRLFEQVVEHERFYRVLVGERGSSWFRTKMRTALAETIDERLRTLQLHGKRLADQRFVADGFVSALLGALLVDIITWWLEQDRPYTPRQAAAHCFHLVSAILRETTTWE